MNINGSFIVEWTTIFDYFFCFDFVCWVHPKMLDGIDAKTEKKRE